MASPKVCEGGRWMGLRATASRKLLLSGRNVFSFVFVASEATKETASVERREMISALSSPIITFFTLEMVSKGLSFPLKFH